MLWSQVERNTADLMLVRNLALTLKEAGRYDEALARCDPPGCLFRAGGAVWL